MSSGWVVFGGEITHSDSRNPGPTINHIVARRGRGWGQSTVPPTTCPLRSTGFSGQPLRCPEWQAPLFKISYEFRENWFGV